MEAQAGAGGWLGQGDGDVFQKLLIEGAVLVEKAGEGEVFVGFGAGHVADAPLEIGILAKFEDALGDEAWRGFADHEGGVMVFEKL